MGSGRVGALVGGPEKASEIPQGMKVVNGSTRTGVGGEEGVISGNGQGPTLGVGGQRELLNSEILWGWKGAVTSGQRTASW